MQFTRKSTCHDDLSIICQSLAGGLTHSNLSNNCSSSQTGAVAFQYCYRYLHFTFFLRFPVLFSFQTTQSQGSRFCLQSISAYNIMNPIKHCLLYDQIIGTKEYFLNKPSDCTSQTSSLATIFLVINRIIVRASK